MIIDWTYGALAQTQGYFGVGYWLTESATALQEIIAIGEQHIFSQDIARRNFNLDTEQRNFVMDTTRRIFKVK